MNNVSLLGRNSINKVIVITTNGTSERSERVTFVVITITLLIEFRPYNDTFFLIIEAKLRWYFLHSNAHLQGKFPAIFQL